MSDYRKLAVYNKALDFVQEVYRISKKFPQDEQFVLTSQIKRSVTSICLNIAEGAGRSSKKEFVQFLRISLGSSLETSSILDIAKRLFFVTEEEYNKLLEASSEISKMLNGLIKSVK